MPIDIVGTGGDGSGSRQRLDLRRPSSSQARACRSPSTAIAPVVASGAADVLAALGVKIDLSPEQVGRCVKEAGIGFMFAPAPPPGHEAMSARPASSSRTRTIFNLLGPLSNPAGVKRQMVGVFSRQWVQPLAQVLKNLGAESRLGRAWLRRSRRDHHSPARPLSPRWRTAMSAASRSRRKMPGLAAPRRRAEGRRRRRQCRRAAAACSTASPAPIATSRC